MSVLIKRPIEDQMLAKKLKRFTSDFNWIQDNRIDLITKYNKKYIAVKNQSVLFVSTSMKDLVIRIMESGSDIDDYIVDYITDEKISLLF